MRIKIFLLILSISTFCFAQDVNVIAAKIVDAKTHAPIEFVNVGFIGKGIGTISNENGEFSILYKLKDIEQKDVLQISSIGYETKKISYNELSDLISYQVNIALVPTEYDLNEVVIKSAERKRTTLGHSNVTSSEMGYWRNAEGLGGEIASVITVRKNNTRLLNLKFKIIENLSDSIRVRVNVYDNERGVPGKNILTQNIYHTISKKKGLETIDLVPFSITVNDDVVVSLELVEVYGTAIYFALSASAYGGLSFTRELSQDHWKIYRKVGMGFSLDSSYPAKGKNKEISSRPRPEKIHLLWDTSLLLQNRNVKEELQLLKKYIQSVGNVEIVVDKFSDRKYDRRIFSCYKGKCRDLLNYLESSQYNGTANYESLLQDNTDNAEVTVAFTNGNTFFEPLNAKINIPTFIVNSKTDGAHDILQELASKTGGVYINLGRISTKKALDHLLFEIDDNAIYKEKEDAVEDYYYGVVYSESGPVNDALVRVKNTFEEVRTKSNGSYKIAAKPGDVLEIEALGMTLKDTVVGAFKKVHIPLKADRELLDEVKLQQRKEEKELVLTPFGKTNPDAVGFSMAKQIKSEHINPSFTELWQILNWGTGIDAVKLDDFGNTKYRFRKFKYASISLTTYAAIVLDGIVYDQNIPGTRVPVVNPQAIERIVLLSSGLSTVRYGSAAAYGAIIIETKGYAQSYGEEEEIPSALVTGNEYEEKVITLEQAANGVKFPEYMVGLEASTSFEMAEKYYFILLSNNKSSIVFHILAANYFEKWNHDFAQTVRSNILSIAPNNTKALKVLAYQLEKNGSLKEAQSIYEKILNIDPDSAQSYRDLAHMYVLNEAYADAASLYKQMIYNTIPNVDFIEFQDILLTEFQHLIKNYKSKIDFKGLPNELLSLDFKRDIRLVLEWNAPAIEFEVQFVNPENKFYSFSHTFFNNKELLKQEIANGILMKEFIIDDDTSGRWLVNIKYVGPDEKSVPVVLKYTLYQNYGLPEETKTIKTIQLDQFHDKVTLDTFIN